MLARFWAIFWIHTGTNNDKRYDSCFDSFLIDCGTIWDDFGIAFWGLVGWFVGKISELATTRKITRRIGESININDLGWPNPVLKFIQTRIEHVMRNWTEKKHTEMMTTWLHICAKMAVIQNQMFFWMVFYPNCWLQPAISRASGDAREG